MDVRIKHGDQNNQPMFHITGENIPDRAGQTSRKPLHVILVTSTGDLYTAGGGGGSGGDGAINDGSNSTIKASVLQGPSARPGSSANPLLVQFADDPTRQIGTIFPPVTGVQIVGGAGGSVSPSGDFPVRIASATIPLSITGDVSTKPTAGQFWPVKEQNVIGVIVLNQGGSVSPSGDFPIRIGAATAPFSITGDVSTVPKVGQVWPVAHQGAIGVQIVGGSAASQVAPSGDFPVRIGAATVPFSVTGDVSTIPKVGQTWQVREQGVVGVQIVGGQVGGSHGVTGDVTIKPGTIPAGQYFPVSGDTTLADGVNRTVKATVKQYTDSNPVAVVLMNPSGDAYIPTPKEPICATVSGRITSSGTTTIAGPYNGRVIKVIRYEIVAEPDNAGTTQCRLGSNASGDSLSVQWPLNAREGVVEAVSPVGGGYLMKTNLNHSLVFESAGAAFRYSVTFQTGDSF